MWNHIQIIINDTYLDELSLSYQRSFTKMWNLSLELET